MSEVYDRYIEKKDVRKKLKKENEIIKKIDMNQIAEKMAIEIYFDNEIINETKPTLNQYYHTARSYWMYNENELKEIYNIVASILENKYKIKIKETKNNYFKIEDR